MSKLPRPNPDHAPAAHLILTAGTKRAIEIAEQLANGAAYRLQTWRLHQSNCESCAEVPEDDKCGPGCKRGWPIWCKWRNAQDHADGLGALLRGEPPEPQPEPVSDQLTLI